MTAITSSSPATTRRFGLDRLLPRGLLAAGVAAAANLLLFVVAKGLFDVSFVLPYRGPGTTPEPLPASHVAISSVVPVIVAVALLWVLGRVVPRPLPVFRTIALLALLASFGGPLSLEDVATSTRVALLAMHVVAAAVILGLLPASTRVWPAGRAAAQ